MGGAVLLEATDSSSVCMRSVAAALRGEFLQPHDFGPWVQRLAPLLSRLGPGFNTWVVNRALSMTGTAPEVADHITTAHLARHALGFYHGVEGPYEALILGAPNGGVAHLATALQVPFLSQHFLTSFRDHKHPDDIETYQAHGEALAKRILARNPDLAIINHYDPLHDRFLVRWVNHIRYKLLDLPQAYREAIRRWLKPGGAIIFIDCRYPWRQYRVGERHTFQVGGLGGVSDEEFLAGRPEIEAMQRQEGSPFVGGRCPAGDRSTGLARRGWSLDLPLEIQPESEWGTLPEFRLACQSFARKNGYGFLSLSGDSPEYYSTLAFHAHLAVQRKEGREPQGTFIDCFTQVNPVGARLSSLLPLWLPFNCTDSLAFLKRMTAELPKGQPVLFAPVPNFAGSFDTVEMDAWMGAFSGFDVHLLGVNPRHYPADLAALFRFTPAVKDWCDRHPAPVRARLSLDELQGEHAAANERARSASSSRE